MAEETKQTPTDWLTNFWGNWFEASSTCVDVAVQQWVVFEEKGVEQLSETIDECARLAKASVDYAVELNGQVREASLETMRAMKVD